MQVKVPKIFKNFYVVATIVFVLWMLFLDPNNLWRQIKQKQKVNEEREKVEFYKQNIEVLSKKSKNMSEDDAELERYAREKFYMKKKSEDVFIVTPEAEAEK